MNKDERAAVTWLVERLGRKLGFLVTLSDMVRMVLGDALKREVLEAEKAGDEVPEAVRRVL